MDKFAHENKRKKLDRKIRVGAVSYLNTKPLVYGLQKEPFKDEIILSFDYPALLASQLINDEIDIGLVPIAVFPQIPNAEIITNYCIGASKPVGSVSIFSTVPINEINRLFLDYQSRTSVMLAQVLLKEYWKHQPIFVPASPDYEKNIGKGDAAVIIGDRAMQMKNHYPYEYDLAEAWIKLTGLPFVFAAWICNKKLDDEFLKSFNAAVGLGLSEMDFIAEQNAVDYYDLKKYYKENLDFVLDAEKRKGLELFLKKLELRNQ